MIDFKLNISIISDKRSALAYLPAFYNNCKLFMFVIQVIFLFIILFSKRIYLSYIDKFVHTDRKLFSQLPNGARATPHFLRFKSFDTTIYTVATRSHQLVLGVVTGH